MHSLGFHSGYEGGNHCRKVTKSFRILTSYYYKIDLKKKRFFFIVDNCAIKMYKSLSFLQLIAYVSVNNIFYVHVSVSAFF